MRVGAVVAGALALVAVGLGITLSHRAPRDAGSNHVAPATFAATMASGGELCQLNPYLPPEAASAQIVIGTYGPPVPALGLRFTDLAGTVVSAGHLAAGARQGPVSIPIGQARDPASATRVCLDVGDRAKVAIGGQGVPPDPTDEVVNGRPQAGRISIVYYRAGEESWWSLFGVIDRRFGLGKAGFFGDGTLPACILLLAVSWAVVVRLLVAGGREARE